MTYAFESSDDLANMYATFGDEILYTPSGGDAVSIAIIFEEFDPSSMDVPPPGDSMTFRVRKAEMASPLPGDTYTISGDTWYFVENVPCDFVDEWKLLISRSDNRRIGRMNFG